MSAPRQRVIRFSSCRATPWKNGGGTTTEIAVSPEGAGFETFDWRVSMAEVASDGPFSSFPGIDRTLAIVEGAGLHLGIGEDPPRAVTPLGCPLPFPADVRTAARLIAGPVTDLNVMTRRATARHTLAVLDLAAGDPVQSGAPTLLLLARDAPVDLATPAGPVRLGPRDGLLVEHAAGWRAHAPGGGILFHIALWPA
jgi:environmental stress-induced protein Ves